MRKQQVLNQIGEKNWSLFEQWMEGRTVGVNPDGTFDYYNVDVERFSKVFPQKKLKASQGEQGRLNKAGLKVATARSVVSSAIGSQPPRNPGSYLKQDTSQPEGNTPFEKKKVR